MNTLLSIVSEEAFILQVDKLEEHAKEKLIRQETSSSEHAQGFCELAFASTSSQTEVEQDAKSSAESKKARPLISTHKLSPNAKPFQPQGLPDLAERLAVRQREEAADLTKQQAVEQISGKSPSPSITRKSDLSLQALEVFLAKNYWD